MIMFISTCPLKVQIFQGLGPFFQIELLKTERVPRWIGEGGGEEGREDPRGGLLPRHLFKLHIKNGT